MAGVQGDRNLQAALGCVVASAFAQSIFHMLLDLLFQNQCLPGRKRRDCVSVQLTEQEKRE